MPKLSRKARKARRRKPQCSAAASPTPSKQLDRLPCHVGQQGCPRQACIRRPSGAAWSGGKRQNRKSAIRLVFARLVSGLRQNHLLCLHLNIFVTVQSGTTSAVEVYEMVGQLHVPEEKHCNGSVASCLTSHWLSLLAVSKEKRSQICKF